MSAVVQALPTAAPNSELIESLYELLELAKSGELRSLAIAGTLRSGLVRTGFVPGDVSVFETLGAIEHVKLRFWQARIEVPE